jgi:hypothetical protein
MPVDYLIDHNHKVLVVKGRGLVVGKDLSAYERIAARPETAGYNVLIDLSRVEEIEQPSEDQIRNMAGLFNRIHICSKAMPLLVIVAHTDYLYGLARVFQGYREAGDATTVAVFRRLEDAKRFLSLPPTFLSEGTD